jgi:tetratricopeptide (TPR) repeat protein
MNPAIRRRRTFMAVKDLLLRESREQPLIVAIDDAQWIDGETHGCLDMLADALEDERILLVVDYRPGFQHDWSAKPNYREIRLDSLSEDSARELLSAQLGADPQLDALKQTLIERTQGNPFFMEETVRALFEQGVLKRNGTIKLGVLPNEIRTPTTVQGVLAARIDRLHVKQKELLQNVSVLGRQFPLAVARKVVDFTDAEIDRILDGLCDAGFIHEADDVSEITYCFRHSLTQQVAEGSVLFQHRRSLHERAAQAIETIYADRLSDQYAILAHHYGRSNNFPKGVEYSKLAGDQAMVICAETEAVQHLKRGIELLEKLAEGPDRDRLEIPFHVSLSRIFWFTKGPACAEVGHAIGRALELSQRTSDPLQLFQVVHRALNASTASADYRRALELGEELLALAEGLGVPFLLAVAHFAVGTVKLLLGQLAPAREHFDKAIPLYEAEQPNMPDSLAARVIFYISNMGMLLWALGYADQAVVQSEKAVALAEKFNVPSELACAIYMAGWVRAVRREYAEARALAERSLRISSEYGFSGFVASSTLLRGWSLCEQGETEEGIARIREGIAGWLENTGQAWASMFRWVLGRALGKARGARDGLREIDEAAEFAERSGEHVALPEIYRTKGELLLAQPEPDEAQAEAFLRKALALAREQGARSLELRSAVTLGRFLARRGEVSEARALVADIHGWFAEGFQTYNLREAAALLDDLA